MVRLNLNLNAQEGITQKNKTSFRKSPSQLSFFLLFLIDSRTITMGFVNLNYFL